MLKKAWIVSHVGLEQYQSKLWADKAKNKPKAVVRKEEKEK